MLASVRDWMEHLYPTRTWGQPDWSRNHSDPELELDFVTEQLEEQLVCSAVLERGPMGALCDSIYLLCQGREPSILQSRVLGTPLCEELASAEAVDELYMRVSVCRLAPLAIVQELQVRMRRVEGAPMVQENFAAGVYSAPLLKRFRKLVNLLPSFGLCHLDMGEISKEAEGFNPGHYRELFGCAPHEVNFLFFEEPSTMSALYELFDPGDLGENSLVAL